MNFPIRVIYLCGKIFTKLSAQATDKNVHVKFLNMFAKTGQLLMSKAWFQNVHKKSKQTLL